MIFLFFITILLFLVMAICVSAITQSSGKNVLPTGIGSIVIFMLPTIVLTAPLWIELLQMSRAMGGRSVETGYDYLPMIMMGAGGAGLLAAFGHRAYRLRKQPETGFFSLGVSAVGLIISAYIVFVSLDQYNFFNQKDAGTLNWTYFRNKVSDVKCNSDILLVNGINSKEATYRCPSQLLIIPGRFTETPFVAWPDYTEGRSEQLAVMVRQMHEEAVKSDE